MDIYIHNHAALALSQAKHKLHNDLPACLSTIWDDMNLITPPEGIKVLDTFPGEKAFIPL